MITPTALEFIGSKEKKQERPFFWRFFKLIMFLACALAILPQGYGQIVIDDDVDGQNAVEQVLLGGGVQVSNVTFSGDENQIGAFNAVNSNLGMDEGVIIATGDVNFASGSSFGAEGMGGNQQDGSSLGGGNNGASDPDLDLISVLELNDAAILEFDFIPVGDSISFEYIFASEEYPNYVCAEFNDLFGFFLSGPGINGQFSNMAINIAIIPNTDPPVPVSINSVNSGVVGNSADGPANCEGIDPNWQANSIYYVANHETEEGVFEDPPVIDFPENIEYNGYTVVLTASAAVECGVEHHIKMAIADAGDTGLDSAVFLKANSLSSSSVGVTLDGVDLVNDSTVYEMCSNGNLLFSRPENALGELILDLEITGTATNGVDFSEIPNQVVFAVGEFEKTIPFSVFADDIVEGTEFLDITVPNVTACGPANDSGTQTQRIYILETEPITASLDDLDATCGEMITLTPQISGGTGQYQVMWSNGLEGETITVFPEAGVTNLTYTITDNCNGNVDGAVSISIPISEVEVTASEDTSLCVGESTTLTAVATGGVGDISYRWTPSIELTNTINVSPFQSTTYMVRATDECGNSAEDVVSVEVIEFDVAIYEIEKNDFGVTLVGYSSPVAIDTQWDFGDGITATGDRVSHVFEDIQDYTVTFTATHEAGCVGVATYNFVPISGVFIPSAFTPNGDGLNDYFAPVGNEIKSFKMSIFDKWGALVFTSNSITQRWNGSYQGGDYYVQDGVFNYAIVYETEKNEVVEKRGSVTIFR